MRLNFARQYGHKLGICGNSDIQIWETGDKERIRREVLRKLNAAKGGEYIFQSDHSVASNVSGHTYDYIVKLVRQYGQYPLNLEEFDLPQKGRNKGVSLSKHRRIITGPLAATNIAGDLFSTLHDRRKPSVKRSREILNAHLRILSNRKVFRI